jgi:hypothetical protein
MAGAALSVAALASAMAALGVELEASSLHGRHQRHHRVCLVVGLI